jgi:exonuclease VII small subunit
MSELTENTYTPKPPAMEMYYAPTEADQERITGYVKAEELLDLTEHQAIFDINNVDVRKSYISFDFAGLLTRLMRHYTFGPDFTVRAVNAPKKADANIQRILDNSDAVTLFRETAESLPMYGDAVIRVDLVDPEDVGSAEKQRQALMRYVKPHQVTVERDPMDNRKVDKVTLAWLIDPRKTDVVAPEGFKILLREVHTVGSYQYFANYYDGSQILDSIPVGDVLDGLPSGEQLTGINEIPIVFIPNNRQAGEFWGRSEFKRIKHIIQTLEKRMAQLDEVLEKHARPKLIVGPGTLDDEGRALLDQFDLIEVEASVMEKAVKPEYLTWDMQIEAIKHQIEKLEEYFFMFTETSPASFGLERDGSQVESARALKFKAHRTINKVEDLRDTFGDAIKKLMRIAQKLETGDQGTYTYKIAQVQLLWPDPIIEDDTQESQDYSLLKQNGLVSVHRTVKDIFNLTDEEAEVERARILEDEADFSEAAGSGIPALGFGGPAAEPLPAGGEAAPAAGLGEGLVEEVPEGTEA